MAIGTRKGGTATGPAIGPRFIDGAAEALSGPGAGDAPPTVRALAVVGYDVAVISTPAASGGIARATFQATSGVVTLVDRMFVSCDSVSDTELNVYVGGTEPRNQRDYAPSGNKNIADNASPIHIEENETMTVEWSGADNGSVGLATVQYRICIPTPVPAGVIAGLV